MASRNGRVTTFNYSYFHQFPLLLEWLPEMEGLRLYPLVPTAVSSPGLLEWLPEMEGLRRTQTNARANNAIGLEWLPEMEGLRLKSPVEIGTLLLKLEWHSNPIALL